MKMQASFGSWLKQRRKALDLTQQDVADQVGWSVVTIRKFEREVARPSRQIAERLADVLVVSPEDRATFINLARRTTNDFPLLSDDLTIQMPRHNLPAQATPFIGRGQELTQIAG